MSYSNPRLITHLEKFKSFLQSCLAFFEQYAHLPLMKKLLDFASLLLGCNKAVNFMEGAE
jgi:hypothetical protein